jgi:hypothetical protein
MAIQNSNPELWKSIPDTIYEVSTKGNARLKDSPKSILLKPQNAGRGYLQVRIPKSTLLHRLVAKAFIPNPDNLPQVDHIDFDKTNNCVENLQWSQNRQNCQRSQALPISLENKQTGEKLHYVSCTEASKFLNCSSATVTNILKGKNVQERGFIVALSHVPSTYFVKTRRDIIPDSEVKDLTF